MLRRTLGFVTSELLYPDFTAYVLPPAAQYAFLAQVAYTPPEKLFQVYTYTLPPPPNVLRFPSLFFVCVFCLHVCLYHEYQKRLSGPLKLELQTAVSTMCVLGMDSGCSVSAANVLL